MARRKAVVLSLAITIISAAVCPAAMSAVAAFLTTGARVFINDTWNVRSTPHYIASGANVLGTLSKGAPAVIESGPVGETVSGAAYTWWQVSSSAPCAALRGWVSEDGLDPDFPEAVKNNLLTNDQLRRVPANVDYGEQQIQKLLEDKGSPLAAMMEIYEWNRPAFPHVTGLPSWSTADPMYNAARGREPGLWTNQQTATPSRIIYDAAVAFNINPKVILTMMQKEQGLVMPISPGADLTYKLEHACGYSSDQYFHKFARQVFMCALCLDNWFRDAEENPSELGKPLPCQEGDPDRQAGITMSPANAATYALYRYNPVIGFPYDATTQHAYGGNYRFYKLWNSLFASATSGQAPPPEPSAPPEPPVPPTPPTTPVIRFRAPAGGETLALGASFQIRWDIAGDTSRVTSVRLLLSEDATGTTWVPIASIAVSTAPAPGQITPATGYTWTVQGNPTSTGIIKVKLVDSAGGTIVSASSQRFSMSPPAFLRIPNNTIIFGNRAYDLTLLDDASLMSEILAAFIANGNRFLYRSPAGDLTGSDGRQVNPSALPTITYTGASRTVLRFRAGDGGLQTLVTVTSIVPGTATVGSFTLVAGVPTTLADVVTGITGAGLTWTAGPDARTYTGSIVGARTGTDYSLTVDSGKFTLAPGVAAKVRWDPQVTLQLSDTASGIGKNAVVRLALYPAVTRYRLLRPDGTPLSGKAAVGTVTVVLFLQKGDACKVELYDAGGNLVETRMVFAQ
jgi:hypothetical protein